MNLQPLLDAYVASEAGGAKTFRSRLGKIAVEEALQVEAIRRRIAEELDDGIFLKMFEEAVEDEHVLDIVDASEIAERLDVKLGTVHAWRARDLEFPPPAAVLRIGPIWEWIEVDAWAIRTGRVR